MAKNSVRYCHADHFLRATGSIQGNTELQQPDSLYVPETVVATDESVNEDVEVASQPESVNAPLRSFRNSKPHKRLIEEMEGQ